LASNNKNSKGNQKNGHFYAGLKDRKTGLWSILNDERCEEAKERFFI